MNVILEAPSTVSLSEEQGPIDGSGLGMSVRQISRADRLIEGEENGSIVQKS